MSNTNIPFRPVRGTDEAIQNMATVNGYLYMATDTRKTYMGIENDKKILMGNDVEVFYGTKEIPVDNSGNAPDPEVTFRLNDIEGDRLPRANDLILNIDGCFYRVELVEDSNNILTKRLTLQGTGSGGSGSGGGSTSVDFSIAQPTRSQAYVFSTEADEFNIAVRTFYEGTAENAISTISFTFGELDEAFYTVNGPFAHNVVHNIDLKPYQHLFGETSKTVTMYVFDQYGRDRSIPFTVRLVAIGLTAITNPLFYTSENIYNYACSLSGATAGVTNKKIVYTFAREEVPNQIIHTIETDLDTTKQGEIYTNLNLESFGHGIYIMQVRAQATIAGTSNIIYSNILNHKIGYYTSGLPLLIVQTPEIIKQYTNTPLEYLFVTDESAQYTLNIYLNNVLHKSLNINSNVYSTYNLYFEDKGSYNAQFTIVEFGITKTQTLIVEAYDGDLPTIKADDPNLMLYLNPKGKTNNDIDREKWVDYRAGTYPVGKLENMNFSDTTGWLQDEEGTDYLLLSSGAKLTVPDFKPFDTDWTANVEGRYGLAIELDLEINGILDFDSKIVSCVSKDQNKNIVCGFEIVGDTLYMYNSRLHGQTDENDKLMVLANQQLVEGKRIRLNLMLENKRNNEFPLCYTYLDGKISGVVKYDTDDEFKDSIYEPASLSFDSSNAQVKIYGIRFYNRILSDKEAVSNYIASFTSLTERQAIYDSNNIYNSAGTTIDFNLISAEGYKLGIPYMVLTGGYATQAEDKWRLKPADSTTIGLPKGKKDYRLVDVDIIYPNDFTYDLDKFSFKNEFENGKGMADNAGQTPKDKRAMIMYAQGTSSMEYPVKNLRLRARHEDDYFTVRPKIGPVEIICMKADYMESSGSHNTGGANLIDSLYVTETPGQDHFTKYDEGGENAINEIVTCIKGYPCLIFYSETGEPNSYEYIGKYNLNLDKATPEPFGFNHDDDKFGYLAVGETYINGSTSEEKTVAEGELINSIHCYEFLDNNVDVCNFKITTSKNSDDNEVTTYDETWHGSFLKDGKVVPGWTLGFESRYPEDLDDFYDAEPLYPLASWVNELGIMYNSGDAEQKAKAISRFANEYQCYFDKQYLLDYYLITEALLMVDSRVKNMMIATWGKEKNSYVNDDGETVETNFYKFYPIFYDMDTMLGLDNTGVARFNYYDEDTASDVYNGQEILWNLVRDALPTELNEEFKVLESAGLTTNNILKYFNDNQANVANEVQYNSDAIYKYINPMLDGYVNDADGTTVPAGSDSRLYAAQGDRSLMREAFVTDRMRFLTGKRNSNVFNTTDRIEFRYNGPSSSAGDLTTDEAGNPDPTWLSAQVVPGNGEFNFTSLKTAYIGVAIGANSPTVIERFDGEQSKSINVDVSSATGTESYILGVSALQDLGDLSNKYIQKFSMAKADDIRLKKLILGSPYKLYHNKYWDSQSQINLNNCYYLEEFNLQNCGSFSSTINFSPCTAIRKILLTGSSVSGLTLPKNGLLTELRLPAGLENLKIDGHSYLTDEGFSLGSYNYDNIDAEIKNVEGIEITYAKIGDEGGQYVNDFSKLKKLHIANTPINSYNIAVNASALETYSLQGINWNITEEDPGQYCRREAEEINKDFSYYYTYDSATRTYNPYEGDSYPSEGKLYEYMKMLDEDNNIICIPILEQLMTKGLFNDDTISYQSHAEALSGTININISGVSVDELAIYQKYHSIYPNVDIVYNEDNMNVTKANRINFYRVDSEDIADIQPYYSVLTGTGTATLADLIASKDFVNPAKDATISTVYTFTGRWIDYNDTNKQVYCSIEGNKVDSDILFNDFMPVTDMNLVPIFSSSVRQFKITLYDYDGTKLVDADIDYSTDIGEHFESNISANADYTHAYYNYREYTDEAKPDNRWTFKGWQNSYDRNAGRNEPTYTSLTGIATNADMDFYAFYVEEDANAVASPDEYFDFVDTTISLNEKYHYLLQGKITLPTVTPQGKSIVIVGNFNANAGDTLFTHIYFKDDNNLAYSEIGNSAFETGSTYSSRVKAVYLPNTIRVIGSHAFSRCRNLETVLLNDNIRTIGLSAFWDMENLINTGLQELPSDLISLGNSAFYDAGPGVVATRLPEGLRTLPAYCLSNCPNVNISTFGSSDSPMLKIEQNALSGAGNNTVKSMNIYYTNGTIQHVNENNQNGAFSEYNVLISHINTYAENIVTQEFIYWGLNLVEGYTYAEGYITQTGG